MCVRGQPTTAFSYELIRNTISLCILLISVDYCRSWNLFIMCSMVSFGRVLVPVPAPVRYLFQENDKKMRILIRLRDGWWHRMGECDLIWVYIYAYYFINYIYADNWPHGISRKYLSCLLSLLISSLTIFFSLTISDNYGPSYFESRVLFTLFSYFFSWGKSIKLCWRRFLPLVSLSVAPSQTVSFTINTFRSIEFVLCPHFFFSLCKQANNNNSEYILINNVLLFLLHPHDVTALGIPYLVQTLFIYYRKMNKTGCSTAGCLLCCAVYLV